MSTQWDVQGPDILDDRLKAQNALRADYAAAQKVNELNRDSALAKADATLDIKLKNNAPPGVDLNPIEQARADQAKADHATEVKGIQGKFEKDQADAKAVYEQKSDALSKQHDSLQVRLEGQLAEPAAGAAPRNPQADFGRPPPPPEPKQNETGLSETFNRAAGR